MLKIRPKDFVFILVCIQMFQCAPPARTKILSFFFDGVERESRSGGFVADSAASEEKAGQAITDQGAKMYVHAVYQERNCSACHDPEASYALLEDPPDLCYNCHENYSEAFEYVHMPVQTGECLLCHSAHSSRHEALLTASEQELCFQCHDESELLEKEPHSEIGETVCSTCHNPHGGADETMMN